MSNSGETSASGAGNSPMLDTSKLRECLFTPQWLRRGEEL
jgi:hypothetical protein